MAATKIGNPWGKVRNKSNPYAIYRADGWEWRVLKAYQSPVKELNNPMARWYTFVTSPMCPEGEYGDTYVNEVLGVATKVEDQTAAVISYKVEVLADSSGVFCSNGLRFATREAAERYALDLAMRWTAVSDWRVVESTDAVTDGR